jgi:hypothetical protein
MSKRSAASGGDEASKLAKTSDVLGTPKVRTGDKFPMDAVVQHTWKKPYTMGQLTEGVSKFVVVTLPGAFTPT